MVKHLTMAIVAMVIYGALHIPLGRIPVADGQGWDGSDYDAMLEGGWARGGPNTALRPLIVWLVQPAYMVTGHVARAFDITNYIFAALLAFLLSCLMESYGASTLARVVAIVCISASNAFRLPAYYPVLIDLGAHAVMALALWHIIAGPRWAAAAASVAAMLSREYAPVVVIFGVIRDLRQRVPLATIATTYLPATIVYVVLRIVVVSRSVGEGNTLQTFVSNMYLWRDPMWAALYFYFLLTTIAGVSLVVAAQPQRWWRVIREEPEWLGLALPMALATALVGIDIWRYFTALTPLAVVLFARCSREWRAGETFVFLSAAVLLTVLTQTPFQGMDVTKYFTEWFPYYAWINNAPGGVSPALLWPGWGWRFLGVSLSLCALMMYAGGRERRAMVTSVRAHAEEKL